MDMNKIPAFPASYYTDDGEWAKRDGMTMRDYFAAKAMFALAIQGTCWRYSSKDPETAKRCYEMADAMLAAR